MHDFTTFFIVLNNLMVLCICMLAGLISRKTGIVNDEINRGLSNLLMKVALPCNIIVSLQQPFTNELLYEGLTVFLTVSTIIFCGAALGALCCKLLKIDLKQRGVWVYAMAFPNIVYMGFPVIQAIYGQNELFYVTFGSIAFNVIAFSFGIKWITIGYGSQPSGLKNLLSNVALMAIAIGLVMFIFSISLPETVRRAFSMMGSMTTPLSMIIIGSLLAKNDPREIFVDWRLYILAFLKLIVIPAAAFLALRPWIHNQTLLGIIVIVAGMPSATNTAIFAERFGANSALAAKTVFICTLLCIVTIPVIALLI